MTLRYGLIFLFCFLIQGMTGQVKFYAYSDAKKVVPGQYFTVSFSLENARGSDFKAPSFVDFDVASGPNTSQEMTFLNGRSKQKLTYSFTLVATDIGEYFINPASIVVNGQRLRSEPLAVEVIKGKTQEQLAEEGLINQDFMINAEVDFSTGYVGQQITLKYVLLTTKDVRSFNFRRIPEFDGFFSQEIQNSASRTEQVIVGGVPYYKRTLKVFALFPQQKGKFTIDRTSVVLGVPDGKRSSSFFFNTRLKQFQVNSNSVEVHIVSPPPNAPVSFSGAIGDFYLGTAVDKKSITQDDAITLTLQIRGFGDGKFIQAPKQPYTTLFDIYDPNLLADKSEVVGEKIQVTKTFEYLMIPKKTGLIKFNPELTYYDVDSARYITIYAQQYRVNVVEGSDRELADLNELKSDLILPQPITSLKSIGPKFAYSPVHIGINGVLFLSLIGLVVVRKIRDDRDNIDPAMKRRQQAKKIAVKRLTSSKEYLDQGEIKEFYIHLRQGLMEYISDKTNQPSSQLTKGDIESILLTHNLNEHTPALLEILKKGEQAIYASIAPGQEIEDYKQSTDFIEAIEIATLA